MSHSTSSEWRNLLCQRNLDKNTQKTTTSVLRVSFSWQESGKAGQARAMDFKMKTSWWLNNPFEKYARQIGSSPQGSGLKYPKIFQLPPPRKGNCHTCHFFQFYIQISKTLRTQLPICRDSRFCSLKAWLDTRNLEKHGHPLGRSTPCIGDGKNPTFNRESF